MILHFFSYVLIFLLCKTTIRYRNLVVCVAILYAMLGFFYCLTPSVDLNHHFTSINIIRMNGFETFSSNDYWKGEYGYQFFLLFISKLPYNNFLPFFSALIGYLFIGASVGKLQIYYSLTNSKTKMVLFYTLCFVNFDSMVNGIRTMLSFSILLFFLIVDIFEKKHKLMCYVAYFVCITIHPACIVPIIIRIISYIFRKKNLKLLVMLFSVWSLILSLISSFLSTLSGIPIIYTINRLLYDYTQNENSVHNIVPNLFYAITMFVRIICIISLIYIYIKSKNKSSTNITKKEFESFYYGIFAFIIGSFFSYHIFLRTCMISLLMSSIVIAECYFTEKPIDIIGKKISNITFIKIFAIASMLFNVFFFDRDLIFSMQLYK